ncbi:UTP--glucose-1-phosphate uridylyltransferase [compost metagenome]
MLLGDDIVESGKPCLKQMIEVYDEQQASIVGVQPVGWDEVSRYGIVDPVGIRDRVYQAKQLVEKPEVGKAPSNLAIMGRYILTPAIFDILENQRIGVNGEIQLTDAISRLGEKERVLAYHFEGTRHDVGEKLGFIKTSIHYALENPELRDQLLKYMSEIILDSLN